MKETAAPSAQRQAHLQLVSPPQEEAEEATQLLPGSLLRPMRQSLVAFGQPAVPFLHKDIANAEDAGASSLARAAPGASCAQAAAAAEAFSGPGWNAQHPGAPDEEAEKPGGQAQAWVATWGRWRGLRLAL